MNTWERLMKKALRLASRGKGAVSPNPMVGALVLNKGRVVGQGYHQAYGGPHAEIHALRAAGKKARGGTLIVTLEPCNHTGKTPPCTRAIIRAGIAKVICAMRDPNPRIAGRGIATLRKNDINVMMDIMKKEAQKLNEPYSIWITKKRPYVALKVAMSLDQKIARQPGEKTRITGRISQKKVHELRAAHDAVLIGKKTAMIDNPRLTVRRIRGRNPWRVLLDSALAVPETHHIYRDKKTIVFTTRRAPEQQARALQRKGASVIRTTTAITPRRVLHELKKRGIASILIEGGAEVFSAFINARLVDRLYAFVAPTTIGPKGVPAWRLAKPLVLKNTAITRSGSDLLVTGQPYYQKIRPGANAARHKQTKQ